MSMSRSRPDALQDVVRYLWGRAIDTGDYRVVDPVQCPAVPGWRTLRVFDVIGPSARPALLVERGRPGDVARSLVAYRRLRTWKPQAARLALAATARAGIPLPGRSLQLQRREAADPSPVEPLSAVAAELDRRFNALVGIRRGANAKATAQLFASGGEPLGYAKVAWNALTEGYVRTEAHRLAALAGRAGSVHTPRLAAVGEALGMSFLVSEPLPAGVGRLRHAEDLTLADLCGIAPVVRAARPGATAQLEQLTGRLAGGRDDPVLARVWGPLADLADRLGSSRVELPVAAYDHGDLVPWNAARNRDGAIWVWDWESSQEDTVAGTDVVHWFVHAVHGPAPQDLAAAIADAGHRAAPALRALGMGTVESRLAVAVYVLISAERACSLARQHGGWSRNRVSVDTVLELTRLGRELVSRTASRGGG